MTLFGSLEELNKIVFVKYQENLLISEQQFSNNYGENDGMENGNTEKPLAL